MSMSSLKYFVHLIVFSWYK